MAMENETVIREVTCCDLVNHLFLPKRLPQSVEANLPEIEQKLLETLIQFSEPLLRNFLPNTIHTLQTWAGLQSEPEGLYKTLAKLEENASACLYVRSQNCTIIFTKLDEKCMRVITFRSSLPNENITETCGSLMVTYPETVDVVPISPFLVSPCFSQQLKNLTVNMCPIAMPLTKKADQMNVETREPSYPYMVSDFLVDMLCPANPGKFWAMGHIENIKFQKKIRDQVNWKDCSIPFRRSGLWTSAKVILQLSLNEEMKNKEEAYIMYKIITLEVLISVAIDYSKMQGAHWDVTSQIMTKLARRAKKISEMKKVGNDYLNNFLENTLQRTWLTIDNIYSIVSQQWNATTMSMADCLQISKIDQSVEDWNQNCIHYMNDLTNYLNTDRIPPVKSDAIDNLLMINSVIQTQTVTLESLLERCSNPLSQEQDFHLNEMSVWIYQVEWFARHRMSSSQSCENIFELLTSYLNNARHLSDPVYYSKFTITVLKFVAVLDEIAVGKHPLLLNYETGILPEMFHSLLIPEKDEMKLMEDLQNYFARRNTAAVYHNWLGNSKIGRTDFCVQYAQENFNMKQQKESILKKMEMDIQSKTYEIQRAKNECNELKRQISSLSCSYWWDSYHERNRHDHSCLLCSLKSQLQQKRISVDRYQRPLPPVDHLKDAVVFELLIPKEIAVLRDSVGILIEDILKHDKNIFSPKVPVKNIHAKWMEFRELGHCQPRSSGHGNLCHLGSQFKDMLTSHYGARNPDVLDSPLDDFIVENGLDCNYYRTIMIGKVSHNPSTFDVTKTHQEDAEAYKSLQFALSPGRPTENKVIANQNTCHQKITLKEFQMFGSMRCAQNAQLRNLYAVLASKVLSLEKEPVLQLVMQTLWELGPGKRDIHVDFELEENKQFAMAFLDNLSNFGEENATNWSNPMTFLSLTVVTVRILEMSDSFEVKDKASRILQRYRAILEDWCVKLKTLLEKSPNDGDTKALTGLILNSAVCCMFTFNVSPEIFEHILKGQPDITIYLKALSRLHHLVVRGNILTLNPPSEFIQSLLRHARHTIPLNLQEYLCRILSMAKFNLALHDFVSYNWTQAQSVPPSSIPVFIHSGNIFPVKQHAFQAKYVISSGSHTACVDILRGTFFVDGYPPSLLPESIIKSGLYKSFFRTSQFNVQRIGQTFGTTKESKYRGLDFQFTQVGDRLIIRQLADKDEWFELLPKELMKEEVNQKEIMKVPGDLIDNYTHWFDSKTKSVYFRRPSSSDTEEIIEDDTEYILVPKTKATKNISREWLLTKCVGDHEISTTNYLISIQSFGFKRIAKNFKKLEAKNYMHVIMDKSDGQISVNLWRHNLSFSLNQENGLLYCKNYPGYYIPFTEAGGQYLGTLVGLQSGIILEKLTITEPSGKKKIFLIQHCSVSIPEDEESKNEVHQIVKVKGEPRSPSYFVFEIDQILKRLRPGNNRSAWLYLALLHATTSSPFPDPFTQLTGTEMAIWILQSGFSWSCSPYDSECWNTLKQLSKLSPKYEYYPNHLKVMETVNWPEGLSTNFFAAYDGYAIIVQKLLEDSVRLGGLFQEKYRKVKELNLDLCKRSYYRNINMYNKAAHLSCEFVEDPNTLNEPSNYSLSSWKPVNGENDLITLAKHRMQGIPSSNRETISSFILTENPLPPNTEDMLTNESISTWLNTNLHENWLQLYTLALKSTDENEHIWTMILGAMRYSGEGSLNQLLNLHNIAIARKWTRVSFPEIPKSLTNDNYNPLNNKFVIEDIIKIIKGSAVSPPSSVDFETVTKYNNALHQYNSDLQLQSTDAADFLKNYWPTGHIDRTVLTQALSGKLLLKFTDDILNKINDHLRNWYNNHNLKCFIVEVDRLLTAVKNSVSSTELYGNRPMKGNIHFRTMPDNIDKWQQQGNPLEGDTEPDAIAKQIFVTGHLEYRMKPSFTLIQQRNICMELAECFTNELNRVVLGKSRTNFAFDKAGLLARTAPVILLRDDFGKVKQLNQLKEGSCYVGALAVVWANLKRFSRIIMYDSDREKYSVEFEREIASQPCENWNPMENPEWLLLELELDITIRPVQVQVARQMMKMPCDKNGVLQLNMGEGKTSVIIPMIVATLSSTEDLLCRVTVLNSIFTSNYNLLASTIGGFLTKRLYSVPCNREMKIGSYLDNIKQAYSECLRLGGAVITLPEYRLSFRLQMYNNFLQNDKGEVGLKINNIESWLRKHARDLVDESDEIFSVKYQLIYTTGKQLQIDGGSMRWTVCQTLLEFLPTVATKLLEKYGDKMVEFQPEEAIKSPHQFTSFRILGEDCKTEFCDLIAEGILGGKINLVGKILKVEEKRIVKEFLINEKISKEDHDKIFTIEGLSNEKLLVLMLVSGYLRRGVLFTALRKRWRVEYGVKETISGSHVKLMAVPFKAKDVASERTEFGHPDMAIALTLLSYYYSGLNDEQLIQCFNILNTKITGPGTVYKSWIKKVSPKEIKSETVKTYEGINLQDYEQRTNHLFPILTKHKAVVDFWLENVAFPKECKQFPRKLVTNAWDLCYHRNEHATTGFSGTNDTSLLLPAQISQQDLKVLAETNVEMENTLIGNENQCRRSLHMGVTCRQLLQLMTKDNLRVLIDAGALMLEGNEAIAQLWLETDKNLEAVVYFRESGEMVMKVRSHNEYRKRRKRNRDQLLTLSPFKDRMENCAIYLDDQHTRGTDIKLPTNFKACVTIGSGMRRDKLIQACMRMRKLGKGQSVHFYLSHEVCNKITNEIIHEKAISVADVVKWTKLNSSQFEKDGLVYWAANAINYTKNLAADELFELSTKSIEDGAMLAKLCEDLDAQKLQAMYGTYYEPVLLTTLIPLWVSKISNKLSASCSHGSSLPHSVTEMLSTLEAVVLKKCAKYIPHKTFLHCMLEEEQEKELEPEVEVEEEKYRPPSETPLEPKLHPNVKHCVIQMNAACVMDGISSLSDLFRDTTIKSKLQGPGWGVTCFATDDFINVIKMSNSNRGNDNLDSFLRAIRFFVSFKNGNDTTVLILSLHEVNDLICSLREKNCSSGTTLHMFSGRWMDGQPIFANDKRLQLPFNATSLDENVMAPLLIAAGNLYFSSMEEQKAFARFLGLRLQPWSEEDKNASAQDQITSCGFVLPSCPALREGCSFQEDPTGMVMGILKIRNDILRSTDHTFSILETCAYFPPLKTRSDTEEDMEA